jgi:hypothetical protein
MENNKLEAYEKASRLLLLCMKVTQDKDKAKELAKQMALSSTDTNMKDREVFIELVRNTIDAI